MSRDFNGTTGYLADNTTAALSGVPATFAAWVRPDTVNAERTILSLHGGGSALWRIEMTATGKPLAQFRNDSGSTSNSTGATTLPTTRFSHVCGTFAANAAPRIFLNGVADAAAGSTPSNTTITVFRTSIGVLNRFGSGDIQFWDGLIAEAAIWSVVLSADEIAALAAGVPAYMVCPASLVFYCPVFGAADPEPELVHGGITLALSGTAPASPDHGPVIGPFVRAVTRTAGAAFDHTITAALTSGNATMNAAGTVLVSGTGALQSAASSMTGAVGVLVRGSGTLQAAAATMSGAVGVLVSATGSLVSAAASVAGTVGVLVSAVGDLVSGPASISGRNFVQATVQRVRGFLRNIGRMIS